MDGLGSGVRGGGCQVSACAQRSHALAGSFRDPYLPSTFPANAELNGCEALLPANVLFFLKGRTRMSETLI